LTLALRIAAVTAVAAATVLAQNGALRLNEIQLIGSHNSYHSGLTPGMKAWLEKHNPRAAKTLDYSHPPLDVQLSNGVRQVEIDIFADPKGGRYATPAGPKLLAESGIAPDAPFDPQGIFKKPGFKVLHVQDIDYRSNCEPFTGCLSVIRDWSDAHPGHLPIFVLIETKEGKEHDFQTTPEPFTPALFDALDAEIRSVFPASKMIAPDDVRGKHKTLEEAVQTSGWPTLESARGKVIFLLDQRKAEATYVEGHPSLRGRVIFTNAAPESPDAAFVEVNDPLKDPELIPGLVRKGYLVRTRTDADTMQARSGDVTQRDAALASGAQLLSTDYPFDERSRWTGYSVRFPEGGIARCNPVLKPVHCRDGELGR
jgi:hypothetical protein